jgi:hypothetical protein
VLTLVRELEAELRDCRDDKSIRQTVLKFLTAEPPDPVVRFAPLRMAALALGTAVDEMSALKAICDAQTPELVASEDTVWELARERAREAEQRFLALMEEAGLIAVAAGGWVFFDRTNTPHSGGEVCLDCSELFRTTDVFDLDGGEELITRRDQARQGFNARLVHAPAEDVA